MIKKALLLITSGIITAILILTASSAQATVPCPLISQANRQIIVLNNTPGRTYILSSGDLAWATLGPVSVNIPSGSYRVTLVSYDDHTHKTSQVQPQEMWRLKLKNADGVLIAQTNSIGDLPDDQNWLTEEVNSDLFLSAPVKSVSTLHNAYYNSNPNSIHPICAAFDKKAALTSLSLLSLNGLTGHSFFTTSLKTTAVYNGLLSDTVNYTFWWNCDSASTDISYLRQSSVCGNPTDPAYGVKYDHEPGGSATTSQNTPHHTYPSGIYTPKIIIERGLADPVEKRIRVTVYNNPPLLSNATVSEPDYCFSGPGGHISWNYADTENDAQSFYRLQVDTLSGLFTSPVYDSNKQPSFGLPIASIPPGALKFNQEYKARVMVWDSFGNASSWENVPTSWTTPQHSYPQSIPFVLEVSSINRGSIKYNFFNQSICYDSNNLATACSRWEYDFNYFSGIDSSFNPHPSHTYFSTGIYQVKETVVDTEGYTCSGAPQDIFINSLFFGPVVWREVRPF